MKTYDELKKDNNGFVSGSVKKVTYTNPSGQSATGYIIGGKTYQDPEGKQRIAQGSTVNTAGGQYTLFGDSGIRTPGSSINALQSGLDINKQAYEAAQAARQQQIDSAVKAALSRLNQQGKQVKDNAELANKQAYQAYVMASNPYGAGAQQRAAIGLDNSGFSESSQVALANTYQNTLAQNEQAKQNMLMEIDIARNEALEQGDLSRANALAEQAYEISQMGMQGAQAIYNAENQAYNMGMENMYRDREFNYMTEQDKINAARYEQEYADRRRDVKADEAISLLNAGIVEPWMSDVLGVPYETLKKRFNPTPVYSNYSTQSAPRSAQYAPQSTPQAEYTPQQTAQQYTPQQNTPINLYPDLGSKPTAISALTGQPLQSQSPLPSVTNNKPKSIAPKRPLSQLEYIVLSAQIRPQVKNSLDEWYNSMSEDEFEWRVADAIATGKITEKELEIWYKL
jgi:hypothetical protein